jgi:hypothetical protein
MTDVVIATRNGIVTAPDGTKHRLVRGKTLADARHPIAEAFPEMFAAHTIDLPYAGTDEQQHDGEPAGGRDAPRTPDGERGSLEYFAGLADEYREQLAAVVETLRAHDALPSEAEMNEPGWLARAVAATFDPVAPPAAPRRGPGRPRKQAAGRAEE